MNIAKMKYLAISVSSICLLFSFPSSAQVIPDDTLGAESSIVNPRDTTSDKIDGGAIRGQNLFHSFQEFNVDVGREVYFTNPDDIANIFSRVTGNNISNILGTLGVDGAANLFFLNPNGIIFGEGASIYVQGSFVATTANGISFGEQGFFSATNPDQSSLLKIDPGAFFHNQVVNQPGNIINRGNLVTNQDLTLDANNLDLQGKILAGQDLTLSALDTVKIRDSVDNPFIGAARGNLFIRGNETIDIFALSNQESGLFSGRDLVLQSSNPIGGDTRFWSSGNFRIEQLNGNLGDLSSPHDPIIRVKGDLTLNNYVGSSLHILAGGSVIIPGTIIILDVDTQANAISENITLSDETVIAIDGNVRPTLDIRAGVEPSLVDIPSGFEQIGAGNFPGGGEFFTTPTSAGILIGSIIIEPPDGQVLITNQYSPNTSLTLVDILITGEGITRLNTTFELEGIDARAFGGDGSSVILDSRGSILLFEDTSINSSSEIDKSGNIKILAVDDILFGSSASINAFSNNNRGGDISLTAGKDISLDIFAEILTSSGGEIQIQANQLLMDNFSQIGSPVTNTRDGGDIKLNVSEAIRLNGGIIGTFTLLPQASGSSGNITIETGELTVIGAALFVGEPFPEGFLTGGDISSEVSGNANAGDIEITARQIRLSDGAQIRASTFGTGDAGNIMIEASDLVEVTGIILESDDSSKISTETLSMGNAGEIKVKAKNLFLSDSGLISTSSSGAGNSGNIFLNVSDSLEADNSNINTSSERSAGGRIDITAENIRLRGNSDISTNVNNGVDNGGNVTITADSVIAFDDSDIFAFARDGQGGNITLDTPAYFGENFTLNSLTSNPDELEDNSRADINATGAVSGDVSIPDVSFIQNSLTELQDNAIDTDELVANSCVVRSRQNNGKFIITGTDSLPLRPGNAEMSEYPTGEVRSVFDNNSSRWQPGDPIIEPQGVYRLTNGKLVLSRECPE